MSVPVAAASEPEKLASGVENEEGDKSGLTDIWSMLFNDQHEPVADESLPGGPSAESDPSIEFSSIAPFRCLDAAHFPSCSRRASRVVSYYF